MKLIENEFVQVDIPSFVQRAIDVAQAAKKPLLILTSDLVFEQLVDKTSNELAIVFPCPCGNFGSDFGKCRCEPAQIEKHQYKIRETYNKNWLKIDGSLCARNIKYKQMDESCLLLLKAAIQELKLNTYQILLLTKVAGAIAKMDGCDKVGPGHIAEAVSYRMI